MCLCNADRCSFERLWCESASSCDIRILIGVVLLTYVYMRIDEVEIYQDMVRVPAKMCLCSTGRCSFERLSCGSASSCDIQTLIGVDLDDGDANLLQGLTC